MKQLLIEVDDETARELERVAPARRRLRSSFIRHAIRRALDAEIERETAAAYRARPQEPAAFDAAEWDPATWPTARRRPKAKRR